VKAIHKAKDKSEHLIIFIHGFSGGPDTYMNDDKHFSSLLDNKILRTCDIFEFIYHSKKVEMSLVRKTLNFLNINYNNKAIEYNLDLNKYAQLMETHYNVNKDKYRTVNFICHSMGGLIGKKFILNYIHKHGHFDGFYITLATPHRGVSGADKLSFLCNEQLNSMGPFSDFIDQTSAEWSKCCNKINRKYYCAMYDTIVDDKSAFPVDDAKNMVRVDGSHNTITKPKSKESIIVKDICSTIILFLGISKDVKIRENIKTKIEDVLFNSYNLSVDNYYLVRSIDKRINDLISTNNLWICGESGTGKTNIAQHFLIANNYKYHCVDMSPLPHDVNNKDLLTYIHYSLKTSIGIDGTEDINDATEAQLITYISNMINRINNNNVTYIYIDELHISSSEVFDYFIDNITSMISYHTNRGESAAGNIKIIVSTIKNPLACENIRFRSKFESLFNLINLDPWSNIELGLLTRLINRELNLNYSRDEMGRIIVAAKASPRVLKNIIRKAIYMKSISKAISDVGIEGLR